MSKRRVKQQNLSVTGLFKLAGRRKKMDDVFVNHECQSTRKKNSAKKKTNKKTSNRQTNSITNNICDVSFACLFMCHFYNFVSSCLFVCLFVFSRVLISYKVYLVVHFNCIKEPVFKAPEFPCLQYKHCNRYLYQPATFLQPMAGFLCYFYLC